MEDQFAEGLGDGRSYEEGTAAKPSTMKEKVGEKAADAREKVSELGRKAVGSLDAQREKVATAVHATADKIQATADYVREHDVKAMMADVGELVKRYPGQSLAAAAVVGFLVARVFRSHD